MISDACRGFIGRGVQRWGEFSRLAYSACFMKVAESWAFGMLVLLAGLLPDPDRSVASVSVAFNAYGITYMVFLAQSIAVSTRCCSNLADCVGTSLAVHSGLCSQRYSQKKDAD